MKNNNEHQHRLKRYGAALALSAAIATSGFTGIVAHADTLNDKGNDNKDKVNKGETVNKNAVVPNVAQDDLNVNMSGVIATLNSVGHGTNAVPIANNKNITIDSNIKNIPQVNKTASGGVLDIRIPYRFSSKTGKIYKVENARIQLSCDASYMGADKSQTAKYKANLERNIKFPKEINLGTLDSTSTGAKDVQVQFNKADYNALYKLNAKLVYTIDGVEHTSNIELPEIVGDTHYNLKVKTKVVAQKDSKRILVSSDFNDINELGYDSSDNTIAGEDLNERVYYEDKAIDMMKTKKFDYKLHVESLENANLSCNDLSGLDKIGITTFKEGSNFEKIINVKQKQAGPVNVKIGIDSYTQQVGDVYTINFRSGFDSYIIDDGIGKYNISQSSEEYDNAFGVDGARNTFGCTLTGMDLNDINAYAFNLLTNASYMLYNNNGEIVMDKNLTYFHLTDDALKALRSGDKNLSKTILSSLAKGETTYGTIITDQMVSNAKAGKIKLPTVELAMSKVDSTDFSKQYNFIPTNGYESIAQAFTLVTAKHDNDKNNIVARHISEVFNANDIVDSKDGKLIDFLLMPHALKYSNGIYIEGELDTVRGANVNTDECVTKVGITSTIRVDSSSNTIKAGDTAKISVNCRTEGPVREKDYNFDIRLSTSNFKLLKVFDNGNNRYLDPNQFSVDGDTIHIHLNENDFKVSQFGDSETSRLELTIGNITTGRGDSRIELRAQVPNGEKSVKLLANGNEYSLARKYSFYGTSIKVTNGVENSCDNSLVSVKDNVATIVQSLKNNAIKTTSYNTAGQFPNSDNNSLSANLGSAGKNAKGHLIQITNKYGDLYLLDKSHLNDDFNRKLLSDTNSTLDISTDELTSERGWIKYKEGLDLSKYGGYFVHVENAKNCMGDFLMFKYMIDKPNSTDSLSCGFKYYDIDNNLNSHSPIINFGDKDIKTDYYTWNSGLYVGDKPADKNILDKEVVINGKTHKLSEVITSGDVLESMKETPDTLKNAFDIVNPSVLKQAGYEVYRCTMNGKEVSPEALMNEGILFNKNHSDIKFYIGKRVTEKIIVKSQDGGSSYEGTISGVSGNKFDLSDIKTTDGDFDRMLEFTLGEKHTVTINGKTGTKFDQTFGDEDETIVLQKASTNYYAVTIDRDNKELYKETSRGYTGDAIKYNNIDKSKLDEYFKEISSIYVNGTKVNEIPKVISDGYDDIVIHLKDRAHVIVKNPDGKIIKDGYIYKEDSDSIDLTKFLPNENEVDYITLNGYNVDYYNGGIFFGETNGDDEVVIQEKKVIMNHFNIKYVSTADGKEIPASELSDIKIVINGKGSSASKLTGFDRVSVDDETIGGTSLDKFSIDDYNSDIKCYGYTVVKVGEKDGIVNYNIVAKMQPSLEFDMNTIDVTTGEKVAADYNLSAPFHETLHGIVGADTVYKVYDGAYSFDNGNITIGGFGESESLSDYIEHSTFVDGTEGDYFYNDLHDRTVTMECKNGKYIAHITYKIKKEHAVNYTIKIVDEEGKYNFPTQDFRGGIGQLPDISALDLPRDRDLINILHDGKVVNVDDMDSLKVEKEGDSFELIVGVSYRATLHVKTIDEQTGKTINTDYTIKEPIWGDGIEDRYELESVKFKGDTNLEYLESTKLGDVLFAGNTMPGYTGYKDYLKKNLSFTLPSGYVQGKDSTYSLVLNEDDGSVDFNVINYVVQPRTEVIVKSIDENGNLVEGMPIDIMGENAKHLETLITSSKDVSWSTKGKIDISIGSNKNNAPEGYIAIDSPKVSSETKDGVTTYTVVQQLKIMPTEVIVKTLDDSNGNKNVEDVEYTIKDKTGKILKVVKTGENGADITFNVNNVEGALQTKLPNKYAETKVGTVNREIKDGKIILTITNYVRERHPVIIKTIDENGMPVGGVGYTYYTGSTGEHSITLADAPYTYENENDNFGNIKMTHLPMYYVQDGNIVEQKETINGVDYTVYIGRVKETKTIVNVKVVDEEGNLVPNDEVKIMDDTGYIMDRIVSGDKDKTWEKRGTYKIKVGCDDIPTGYIEGAEPTVESKYSDGVTTVNATIHLVRLHSKAKVVVQNIADGKAIEGAVFEVLDKDGKVIGEFTTKANDSSEYYSKINNINSIRLKSLPNGWIVNAPLKMSELTYKNGSMTTEGNMWVERLANYKVEVLDEVTGKPIEGVKIDFNDMDGKVLKEVTSGTGAIEYTNPKNLVSDIKFVNTPENYIYKGYPIVTHVDDENGFRTNVYKFYFKQTKTKVVIRTVDENGNDVAGQAYIVDDKDGKQLVQLTSGDKDVSWDTVGTPVFKIEAGDLPEGYVATGKTETKSVTDENGVTTITVTTPIKRVSTNVQIKAVDKNGNIISGIKINIADKAGKILQTITTNDKGVIAHFAGTPVKDISVTELPSIYAINGEAKRTEETKDGVTTINYVVPVMKTSTHVKVSYKDRNGNLVSGGAFVVDDQILSSGQDYTIDGYAYPNVKMDVIPDGYVQDGDVKYTNTTENGVKTITCTVPLRKLENTTIKVSVVDDATGKVISSDSYTGREGNKTNITEPSIESAYGLVNITDNGNIVTGIPAEYTRENQDIVYHIKKVKTALTVKIKKDGSDLVEPKFSIVKIGSKLDNSLIPADILKDYNIDSVIVNGKNVGNSVKGEVSSDANEVIVNVSRKVYKLLTSVKAVDENGNNVSDVSCDIMDKSGNRLGTLTSVWSAPTDFGTMDVNKYKVTSVPKGYVLNGDVTTNRTTYDGVTHYEVTVHLRHLKDGTIKVKVVDENNKQLGEEKVYTGQGNSKADIKSPVIDKNYDLVNITNGDKVISELPVEFSEDNQSIIYHVKRAESTVNVVVKENGKVIKDCGSNKVMVGSELNNNLMPSDFMKDYNLVNVEVNGIDTGKDIKGSAKRDSNTIILNVEHKIVDSGVSVKATNENGDTVAGVNCSIINNDGGEISSIVTGDNGFVTKVFDGDNIKTVKVDSIPNGYYVDGPVKLERKKQDGRICLFAVVNLKQLKTEVVYNAIDETTGKDLEGIVYKVKDSNGKDLTSLTTGKENKEWSAGTAIVGNVEISNLPKDYIQIGKLERKETVKDGVKIITISSIVRKTSTVLNISVVDQNGKLVSGITYDVMDKDGNVIDKLTSRKDINSVSFAGTNIKGIKITGLPKNYVLDGESKLTTVTKDGMTTVTIVTPVKEKRTVVNTKLVDEKTGKDIAGGIYTFSDSVDNKLDSVTTTDIDTVTELKGDNVRKVSLGELPYGYAKVGDTVISRTEKDGVITINVVTKVRKESNGVITTVIKDEKGDIVEPVKSYTGLEGTKATINKVVIPDGYTLVKILDNDKVIFDIPTTFDTTTHNIVYVVKKTTSIVNVDVKYGEKTLSSIKNKKVKTGTDMNNLEFLPEIPDGYDLDHIEVNGNNVGKSMKGITMPGTNNIQIVLRKLPEGETNDGDKAVIPKDESSKDSNVTKDKSNKDNNVTKDKGSDVSKDKNTVKDNSAVKSKEDSSKINKSETGKDKFEDLMSQLKSDSYTTDMNSNSGELPHTGDTTHKEASAGALALLLAAIGISKFKK